MKAWKCIDKVRPMSDTNAVWHNVEVKEQNKYFLMECCPAGCDSIEDYTYTCYTDMFYHHKALVEDDKAIAAEEQIEYEPYEYPMYYIVETLIEEKNGCKYYEENRYPVKAYKYRVVIRCKYI